jgi:HK97 family phage major capsid protein
MQDELKQLHGEIHSAFEDFKTLNEAAKEERSKFGEESALLKEQIGKVNDRLDEIEVKQNEVRETATQTNQRDELREWAATGKLNGSALGSVEVKLMNLDDTTGNHGVLQNDAYLAEIQKAVVEFSPVRQFARVINIGTTAIDIPRRSTTASASFVGEVATRSETTNPDYELVNIQAHELYARADISQQLLEDAEFDLEAEMAMEFGEQFGVAEGTVFVSGTGTGQPTGLLDTSDGIDGVSANEDTGGTLQVEDLFDLAYGVKAEYARNGAWMLNRATLPLIRAFETSAGGYIWSPSIAPGDPNTILGSPYVEATDLDAPSGGTFASGAQPIIFGDYRRAYTIVDRTGVQIQRDPFTLAANGQVRYIARKRVGGKVMIAEAAKSLDFA